jgi:hypothetical protein
MKCSIVDKQDRAPIEFGFDALTATTGSTIPEFEIAVPISFPAVIQVQKHIDPAKARGVIWMRIVIGVHVQVAASSALVQAGADKLPVWCQVADAGDCL